MSNETLPHVNELVHGNRLAAAGQPELPTVQSPNGLRALLASTVAADCVRYRNERSDPNTKDPWPWYTEFDQNVHSESLTTLLHAVYRYRGAEYVNSPTDPGWRLDGLEARGWAVIRAGESTSPVAIWAAAERDVQAAEKSGDRKELRAAIDRRNAATNDAITETNTLLAAVQVALDRPTE